MTVTALLLVALTLFASCGTRTSDLSDRRSAVLHKDGALGALSVGGIPEEDAPGITEIPNIAAAQAFVIDADSGRALFMRGTDKILYPASTTKLLSILCALEIIDTDRVITPGDELSLVNEHSSIAFIKSHHSLTVEMLIEGMLLPSGNDAAYVLAAACGRELSEGASAEEAVEVFVEYMNEYARRLGMCGSNFTSPDGFFDEENYSTVEDMAILSAAAAKNEIIKKYASLASDDVVYASGHTNTWTNTNRMLIEGDEYYDAAVTGLKTGTAAEDNTCFICSFSAGGKSYIAGVFSEIDKNIRFEDMKRIIEFFS